MRRYIIFRLVLLLNVPIIGLCQLSCDYSKGNSAKALVSEKMEYNIGRLEGITSKTLAISVSNIARKAVSIRKAQSSCSCVTVLDFPKRIISNDSGFLRLSFNPRPVPREQSAKVYLQTDEDTPNNLYTFEISGSVWVPTHLNKNKIEDTAYIGSSYIHKIILSGTDVLKGDATCNILYDLIPNNTFTHSINRIEDLGFLIELRNQKPLPIKGVKGSIVVMLNDSVVDRIRFKLRCIPPVYTIPSKVFIGKVSGETHISFDLSIRSKSGHHVDYIDCVSKPGNIEVSSISDDQFGFTRLRVTVNTIDCPFGEYQDNLMIRVRDDKDIWSIDIPVLGFIEKNSSA